MDFKQILKSRSNRHTRIARPFGNFMDSFQQCASAAEAILSGSFAPQFTPLMERAAVITTVTSVEVYYRDMLDFVFRYCSPDFFVPKLKHLHADKYDISELLEVYRHQIHPLELVSSSQSFQNVEKIERVFSKLLGKGFWGEVLSIEVRVKDEPATQANWSSDDLESLKRTFSLRHELVHDPARSAFLTDAILRDLWKSAHMVFGSDVVLTKLITENRDPEIPENGA